MAHASTAIKLDAWLQPPTYAQLLVVYQALPADLRDAGQSVVQFRRECAADEPNPHTKASTAPDREYSATYSQRGERLPYGYRAPGTEAAEVEPAAAEVLRLVLEWRTRQKLSLGQIAEELTARHTLTPGWAAVVSSHRQNHCQQCRHRSRRPSGRQPGGLTGHHIRSTPYVVDHRIATQSA